MWEKYKEYLDDFEQDYFVRFLPGYLLNEGTTLWHEWKFHWELLDNLRKNWIRARLVPFDIQMLLNDYLDWIKNDSDRKTDYESAEPKYLYDEGYEHYKFILSICSFYNIGDIHPVAGRLSLAHQLRLLLFATRKRLFDGSKQRVEEIFNNIELGAGMKLVIQTMTGDENGIGTQPDVYKRQVLTDSDGIAWISSGEIEPIEDEDDDTEIYQFEAECDNFGPHTITAGTTFKHLYVDGTYKTDDILIDPDNLPIVGRLGGYEENDTAFMNRYRELIAEGSLTLSESIMTTLRKEMPGVIKDSMVINSTESEGTVLNVKGLTAANEPTIHTVTVPQHDILIILQPHLGVNLGGESTSQAIAKMLQRLITCLLYTSCPST